MLSAKQLAGIPVISLIPQRAPMVMISRVVAYSKGEIRSEFDVEADNIFVNRDLFSESGMLENIAQTAAAMVGLEAREIGEEVPLGFIGGINKVKVTGFAAVSQTITTQVEILQEVFNITLIRGKCFILDELLMECEMKIVINP
ncbi:putative hotdog family 3-hydroxylacyl-ACP dehydratase [Algoriphagus sp. 4150]|uniref:3-hydroxyacyl-ACP dehydratase n=1 Tax=Algoriphagus sp. 4150 TaxID=2817756 RepID=UPI00285DCFC9|nr:3-hydroxyacyl-ACP dehydratase [Algoriphagus sp. 4150]MDR7129141.1 putative hotdog family 3-hydroxylacyl-ACP dehydratase [Algoriphagus sp. 4150]